MNPDFTSQPDSVPPSYPVSGQTPTAPPGYVPDGAAIQPPAYTSEGANSRTSLQPPSYAEVLDDITEEYTASRGHNHKMSTSNDNTKLNNK